MAELQGLLLTKEDQGPYIFNQVYAERGRTYHLSNHWNCAIGDYQRALTIIQQSPNDSLAEQIHDWMAELLN